MKNLQDFTEFFEVKMFHAASYTGAHGVSSAIVTCKGDRRKKYIYWSEESQKYFKEDK